MSTAVLLDETPAACETEGATDALESTCVLIEAGEFIADPEDLFEF